MDEPCHGRQRRRDVPEPEYGYCRRERLVEDFIRTQFGREDPLHDEALDQRVEFLSHTMVDLQQMAHGIGLGVWDAIARFHRIATS